MENPRIIGPRDFMMTGVKDSPEQEKRDAVVFDDKGDVAETKLRKKKRAQPKKKQPALIARAMEADKEPSKKQTIKEAEPEPEDILKEILGNASSRPKPKPVASYERL